MNISNIIISNQLFFFFLLVKTQEPDPFDDDPFGDDTETSTSTSHVTPHLQPQQFDFKVLDSLVNMGPISDTVITPSMHTVALSHVRDFFFGNFFEISGEFSGRSETVV